METHVAPDPGKARSFPLTSGEAQPDDLVRVVRSRSARSRVSSLNLSTTESASDDSLSFFTPRDGGSEALALTVLVDTMGQQAAAWDAFQLSTKSQFRSFPLQNLAVSSATLKQAMSKRKPDAECVLCPLLSPYGIGDSSWERDLLSVFGSGLKEEVERRVQKEYFGELPTSCCFLLRVMHSRRRKRKERPVYIAFVCLGSNMPSDFGSNYVYASLRSAMVAIDQHNQRCLMTGEEAAALDEPLVDSMIRGMTLPFIRAVGQLGGLAHSEREVARQMALALETSPVSIYDSLNAALEAKEQLLLRVTQSEQVGRRIAQAILSDEEHLKMCKEGLLAVLEHGVVEDIVGRGLSSKEEMQLLVALANTQSTLSSSRGRKCAFQAICMLLRMSVWASMAPGLTRSDLLDAIFEDVDVFMRLQGSDPSTYMDEVKDFGELKLSKKIARGGTSTVHAGEWLGEMVAVKMFMDDTEESAFRMEVAAAAYVWRQEVKLPQCLTSGSLLDHKHILQALAFGHAHEVTKEPIPFLVAPLMERGSLSDLLYKEKETLAPELALQMATQIAEAVRYLHDRGLIHRDLKSANILLDKDFNVYLTDFGTSRVESTNSQMTNMVGTLSWMAPEILQGTKYSNKADIYSYGMVLYEILTGLEPFADVHSYTIPMEVAKGTRPSLPKDIPKQRAKLIKACWQQNPAKRPDIGKILSLLQAL